MSTEGRDAVVVDVLRTTFGKRGGALEHWHPADLLGFALTSLLDRAGVEPGRIDDVIGGCVGQVGEQSTNVTRNAWVVGRAAPARPGHHRRPPVRVLAAGDPLCRRRGRGRPLRPGGGLWRRVDEPGADGARMPAGVLVRSPRRSSRRSTAGCGPSSAWPRCWPTAMGSPGRRWTPTRSRATGGRRRRGTPASSPAKRLQTARHQDDLLGIVA